MEKNEYIINAAPGEWRDYAYELRCNAEILSGISEDFISISTKSEHSSIIKKSTLSRTCLLLIGLSLENLTKGLLITRNPSFIADGELSRKLQTHNILKLLKMVTDIKLSDDQYKLLEILNSCIPNWGRYPVPLKLSKLAKEIHLTTELFQTYTNLYSYIDKKIYLEIRDGWVGPDGIKLSATFDSLYEVLPENWKELSFKELLEKRKLKE